MVTNFTLDRKKTGLLVIDVQEKLFQEMDRACEVMRSIQKVVKGFQILNLPIVVSNQYPEGLGETVPTLKQLLGNNCTPIKKTTFSCLRRNF